MGKGNIVKRWIYKDQLTPAAELESLNNVVSLFAPGYIVKNDSTYAIITDHLGSVRLVVNAQSGAIRQQIDYDEYGNVLLNTNPDFQPFGYAGGLYDEQTELTRFGARDYDASVGRWTIKDPIGFLCNSTNMYEYVINDPINNLDKNGLQRIFIPPLQSEFYNVIGGVSDFIKNYKKMREANTIGADKYFHCMANCEASKRGLGGYLTAAIISEGRELFDQYIKRDPASSCDADRTANNKGRDPKNNTDCRSRCQEFRPSGLAPKY